MKIERSYQKYQQNELKPKQAEQSIKNEVQHSQKNIAFDFSETTQSLKQPVKTLEQSPINSDKVTALKEAIKDGSYKVDAAKLAKAMLHSN